MNLHASSLDIKLKIFPRLLPFSKCGTSKKFPTDSLPTHFTSENRERDTSYPPALLCPC